MKILASRLSPHPPEWLLDMQQAGKLNWPPPKRFILVERDDGTRFVVTVPGEVLGFEELWQAISAEREETAAVLRMQQNQIEELRQVIRQQNQAASP